MNDYEVTIRHHAVIPRAGRIDDNAVRAEVTTSVAKAESPERTAERLREFLSHMQAIDAAEILGRPDVVDALRKLIRTAGEA